MLLRNQAELDYDALESLIDETLDDYQNAPEFADARHEHRNRRFIPATVPAASSSATLAELYAREGKDFVTQAFLLLLGRAPTPQELLDYHGRLFGGDTKNSIACELRYSPEGLSHDCGISLERERRIAQLTSLPVVGRLFALALALLGVPGLKRITLARFTHIHHILESVQHEQTRQQRRTQELNNIVHLQQFLLDKAEGRIAKLEQDLTSSRARLSLLEQRRAVTSGQHQQSNAAGAATGTVAPNADNASLATMEDAFYDAFEERFRGSFEDISERMTFYIPWLTGAISPTSTACPVVDIGCGRGEWLTLVQQQGYRALGLELNAESVRRCRERGLAAEQADGVAWLQQRADNSIAALSLFHVIEHLPFATLNALVTEALRTLVPGGLLILETPNPENLVTGVTHFYTDPTHLQPVPPALTEFLLQYRGFSDVRLHRLHPVPEALQIAEQTETAQRCNPLFYGPQDYGVTAIKPRG